MPSIVDRFAGQFSTLPTAFLLLLDRNFSAVMRRDQIHAADSDYTFTGTDNIDSLQVDATAGNITVYLPVRIDNVRRRVIKTDASANTVTLDGNGLLINGAATVVLAAQYDFVWVEPTLTGWLIIGQ